MDAAASRPVSKTIYTKTNSPSPSQQYLESQRSEISWSILKSSKWQSQYLRVNMQVL